MHLAFPFKNKSFGSLSPCMQQTYTLKYRCGKELLTPAGGIEQVNRKLKKKRHLTNQKKSFKRDGIETTKHNKKAHFIVSQHKIQG